jgi:hypothetical protein
MRGIIRFAALAAILSIAAGATLTPALTPDKDDPVLSNRAAPDRKLDVFMEAYVTGYNTVRAQTDATPCIAASGANICDRRDTAACPRLFDFGTVVEINGKKYVCEDRTAPKFNARFDINCGKDANCPYKVAGWTTVKIFLE